MEFHYPGYNYLGPGTNLQKKKKPINKLDLAAKRHDEEYAVYQKKNVPNFDIYTRGSAADNRFLNKIDKLPWSMERDIASVAFRLKRQANKLFGRSDVESIIKKRKIVRKLINLRNLKYTMLGKRRRLFRRNRRFRRRTRPRASFFKKVMNIINPVRTYSNLHFYRAIGRINSMNFMHLTAFSSAGPILRPPTSFTAITEAITYALGLTDRSDPLNWDAGDTYYIKQSYVWKLSNNSNVRMRATLYYITIKENTPLQPFTQILDSDFWDNTEIFPNNATVDAVAADTSTAFSPNMYSPLNYNPLNDKTLKQHLSRKFSITKGKTMTFEPGQTKILKYKKRAKRFTYPDLFDDSNASIDFPRGTVFPVLMYTGDILAGTKTPADLVGPYTVTASGVNKGDWSYQMNSYFTVQTKFSNDIRKYISNQNDTGLRESTAGDLTCFGFDNNAAVSAV